ncbi:protein kinase domain-containing protein [Citrus sinensis]|uniref:Protein kinase domain-containing protein n=1 Tax=Citrus sinensis TaxID=2711 RepID=A0ACB8MCC6_CITSI|nr:protein kinase domain-containing protein [Citrus sinensis]
MEKYSLTKKLGSGSFGGVWQAVNKHSREVVAIKALKKSYSREKCLNLREVKWLRKLNHPNIVKLKELIMEKGNVFFGLECLQCNLYQLMEAKKKKQQFFSESTVKAWLFQVFRGLDYVHQQGYFHRDLKPENLLASQAIMAELLLFRPLFQGTDEADQMYKICSVLGNPTMDSWADELRQAMAINYQFPQLSGVNLSELMPSASKDAINLIESLCSWDPCKRPTAAEALQHPFFKRCLYVPPHIRSVPAVATTTRGMLEQQAAGRKGQHQNLANMAIAYNGRPVAQKKPPPMKAVVQWNAESREWFLRPIQNLEPGRI